jgi:hypothetical protein
MAAAVAVAACADQTLNFDEDSEASGITINQCFYHIYYLSCSGTKIQAQYMASVSHCPKKYANSTGTLVFAYSATNPYCFACSHTQSMMMILLLLITLQMGEGNEVDS